MSKIDEPEWIIAKRESDRNFRNAAFGVWLACLPIALVMIFVSQFEYKLAMEVAAALMLFISIACFLLRRRVGKGTLARTFSTTLGLLSFLGGLLFLLPTGVTHWG